MGVSFNEGSENFSSQTNANGNLAVVDMSDGEIMNVWRSTQIESEATIETIPSLATSSQDGSRMSFIDAEYDRFIKLGQALKAKKQRSSPPTRPRRLSITA